MKLLAWLTEAFINTFGITRPRPEQERAVQWIIGGFLLAVIAGAVTVMILLLIAVHAGHAQ